MKGLILAAGKGTRLRPITFSIPKPLVPIANKPTFLYAVESFINCGIKDIGIVINEGHHSFFEQAIKNSSIHNWTNFTYIFQNKPKGIAHAVSCAREFVGNDCFILQLGDNIIFHNYQSFIKGNSKCKILLAPVTDISRYGIAEFDKNKIVNVIEKPEKSKSNLALVGLYLFTSEIFKFIDNLMPSPRGEYEITHAINDMLIEYKGLDFDICDIWWKDTGTIQDMLEANKFILTCILNKENEIGLGSTLINSNLGGSVSIGENCRLENSTIENSIILNNVKVQNINILNSIIGENCIIKCPLKLNQSATLVLGNNSLINFEI